MRLQLVTTITYQRFNGSNPAFVGYVGQDGAAGSGIELGVVSETECICWPAEF